MPCIFRTPPIPYPLLSLTSAALNQPLRTNRQTSPTLSSQAHNFFLLYGLDSEVQSVSLNPTSEAPKAVKAVVLFAQKAMGVNDVRISPSLNQALWSRGIKSPPKRVRVRLERKRNDDEAAKENLYVLATVVEGVTSFKVGLGSLATWLVVLSGI